MNDTSTWGFPYRFDPSASGVAPVFFSVRYRVLVSGSAVDFERYTLPWLSSVTWSTSVNWRLPGLGGFATASGASTHSGALSPRFAGTIVTVPVPGGPLEVTPPMVNVRVWPPTQVPSLVHVILIARLGASSVPAQP